LTRGKEHIKSVLCQMRGIAGAQQAFPNGFTSQKAQIMRLVEVALIDLSPDTFFKLGVLTEQRCLWGMQD
jgi:hypothetical protein